MIAAQAVTFAVALLVSLVGTPLARALARRRGFVDEPGERKIHRQAVALGGGVAIFAAVVLPLAGAALAILLLSSYGVPGSFPAEVAVHLPGAKGRLPQLGWIGLGGVVLFGVGLVDDHRGLSAWTKLAFQVVVACGLVLVGVRASLFLDGVPGGPLVSGALSVLWIVGLTNAFNLLDNMDGLCAGVASVAASIFLTIAMLTGQHFIACCLLALLGGCLGFLVFNRPPATIFMGDAGSLFIGYTLSVLTILFTYYRYEAGYHLYSVLVPFFIFAVPAYDTLSVMAIRISQGRSIFQGDTNHLSHRLVALGLSRGAAVLLIYLLTLCTGLPAILIYETQVGGALVATLQVALVLAILAVIETAARRRS
ncbi:MAG: undecaprenyl/decaprenyl-phosphate alpha-N-acetylglucosaminyl 1-phosphate transferase [Planctomycetes bacterium]|nr:undecaprenyl/decaprenyl-phosphate alpha-N-acetylglucosaminyl 1-phosphate transferase [Planctomycetota bacterium]